MSSMASFLPAFFRDFALAMSLQGKKAHLRAPDVASTKAAPCQGDMARTIHFRRARRFNTPKPRLVVIARSGPSPLLALAALLLVLPPVSVAVLAWVHDNPFNGTAFVALCLALGILGARLPALPTPRPPAWSLVVARRSRALLWPVRRAAPRRVARRRAHRGRRRTARAPMPATLGSPRGSATCSRSCAIVESLGLRPEAIVPPCAGRPRARRRERVPSR